MTTSSSKAKNHADSLNPAEVDASKDRRTSTVSPTSRTEGSLAKNASSEADSEGASAQDTATAKSASRKEDQALVAKVKDGDQAAFRQLFDKYHRRAYAVAFGVVKNQQDALDIVQEAFIKVHRHVGNFQGTSSFYTWMYRIVMNLAIDHVRKAKRTKDLDYDDRVKREENELGGDGALLPRILGGDPAKSAMRKELSGVIQKALDSLPEYHRAVITLREIEGLSYEEMSQVLEVPKGTIMSRLFHARRKMQDVLADYLDGDANLVPAGAKS